MSTLFDMDESPVASTGDNEWYTPAYLIEAARKVMGSIYMDPASCPEANQTVRAQRIYTKADDGLSKPWAGPLWLNPPYGLIPVSNGAAWQGRSAMHAWISRLIDEHKKGNVAQAILLTKADPKQIWFQLLWDYPLCFVNDRVYFNRPSGPPSRHMFGTLLAYFGQNIDLFVNVFTEFGPVVTPDGVHRRPSPITQPSLFQ